MYIHLMLPVSVGAILVCLLFPAIVAAAILFPAYVIWRYRAIVARGEGIELLALRRRFVRLGVFAAISLYVTLIVGIFFPHTMGTLSEFIAKGGLSFIVPLIFLNVILAVIFNRERALRRRSSAS